MASAGTAPAVVAAGAGGGEGAAIAEVAGGVDGGSGAGAGVAGPQALARSSAAATALEGRRIMVGQVIGSAASPTTIVRSLATCGMLLRVRRPARFAAVALV